MQFINLHTHKTTIADDHFAIVNQYPLSFNNTIANYSIGIHPWHININTLQSELDIINQNISSKNCLALGECGLDKQIKISLDLQIEIFEKQVQLAIINKKPLILHCVAAFQELIAIKKKLKVNVPMIVHGFSKNMQLANQLLDNEFYLSFGKYLIQNPESKMVFRQIPNQRFFLETDSSEYAIETIYNQAAIIKNIEIDELKNIVAQNYQKIFMNQ